MEFSNGALPVFIRRGALKATLKLSIVYNLSGALEVVQPLASTNRCQHPTFSSALIKQLLSFVWVNVASRAGIGRGIVNSVLPGAPCKTAALFFRHWDACGDSGRSLVIHILTSRLHELPNFWRFLAKPLGIFRSAIKD